MRRHYVGRRIAGICLAFSSLACISMAQKAPEARETPAAQEAQATGNEVLVAYYSKTGHTKSMAEAVAEGADGVAGVDVRLRAISDVEESDLQAADAVIVGSPVYNANVAPEVQSFINGWSFEGSPMRDKIGAAFATGGGISAGEEVVQLSILRSMLVFGMVVVGGPHWTSVFGASAVTEESPFPKGLEKGEVAEAFLEKGRALGRRVGELAVRMDAAEAKAEEGPEPQPTD